MNDHCNLEFSEFGIALGKMQCDDKTTIDDWTSACSDKTDEFLHLISICPPCVDAVINRHNTTMDDME